MSLPLRLFNLLSATLLFFFFSCSSKKVDSIAQNSTTQASEATDTTSFVDDRFFKIDAYIQTSPVDPNDEEWFESDCALMVNPTAEQVEAMKKEYGEEDFHIIADDNVWYDGVAIMLLDSIGVRVAGTSKRYVRLVGDHDTWVLDLRRQGALPWNLILFSTKKGPQIFSTVDLTADQIRDYFSLKPLPAYAEEKFKKYSATYTLGDGLSQQFLEGDFSGDKKQDIAIWVERKDDDKKGILFFFEGNTEPIIVGAGKELGNAGDDFKWAGLWEIVNAERTEETTFSEEGDVSGSKEVKLERPVISIRETEGSGGLIYYDGTKFIWIHQGD